jgi:hypothetical protein
VQDDDEDEEISIPAPIDPTQFFQDLRNWRPPRPSTPMHFNAWTIDREDEYCERVLTKVIAGCHQVQLCIDRYADVEKVIRIFQRRTGLDGQWEGRLSSEGPSRIFEIVPKVAPSVPSGPSQNVEEARVFFGTLEHKDAFDVHSTPEYRLEKARQKEKLDEFWVIDKVFPGSPSSPPPPQLWRQGTNQTRSVNVSHRISQSSSPIMSKEEQGSTPIASSVKEVNRQRNKLP